MAGNLLYVSGALSDVPKGIRRSYIDFYESIGKVVESVGLYPYIPHRNTDPVRHKDVSPREVDIIDRTAVTSAVLIIAVADNPSLGVGIEVEMAYHAHKPVILLCKEERIIERRISRLMRGNPAIVREIIFNDFDEALKELAQYLNAFLKERKESILPDVLAQL